MVYATSRQVAKDFGKRHDHVIESIRDIIKNLAPENSGAKYFISSEYVNRGKKYPEYKLTKDGFTLIAMGFTGTKALKFKIEYINTFSMMESQLNEIDMVMSQQDEMSRDQYSKIKFSTAQRVKKSFLDSQDIFKDYERFIEFSRSSFMDKNKRIKRMNQIILALKQREEKLYIDKPKGYRAERENIIELVEEVLRDINELNNRSYGQKLGHLKKVATR